MRGCSLGSIEYERFSERADSGANPLNLTKYVPVSLMTTLLVGHNGYVLHIPMATEGRKNSRLDLNMVINPVDHCDGNYCGQVGDCWFKASPGLTRSGDVRDNHILGAHKMSQETSVRYRPASPLEVYEWVN